MSHKQKTSSLVTLKKKKKRKDLEIPSQYLYCKQQFSSGGVGCQNKHVFSRHQQTSSALPVSSCSRLRPKWVVRKSHLSGTLACRQHRATDEFWHYALIKKRPRSYEKAPCASLKLFQSLPPPELNVNRHR